MAELNLFRGDTVLLKVRGADPGRGLPRTARFAWPGRGQLLALRLLRVRAVAARRAARRGLRVRQLAKRSRCVPAADLGRCSAARTRCRAAV